MGPPGRSPADELLSNRTVLLVADIRHEQLPNLLDHVDRAVAIVSDDEEARTVARLASEPALQRHPVEVVLVAEAPGSRPRGLTQVQGTIPVTRLVRILLTDEPVVEPPPALYAAPSSQFQAS